MKYPWLEDYILHKAGTRQDYQEEWQATRYLIEDKMFMMIGQDKQGKDIITIKLVPEDGRRYRERYPEKIVPGYYMNKVHWNSIYVDANISDDELKEMIDLSYLALLHTFSKKKQKEIGG